jgi:hypothetical protein
MTYTTQRTQIAEAAKAFTRLDAFADEFWQIKGMTEVVIGVAYFLANRLALALADHALPFLSVPFGSLMDGNWDAVIDGRPRAVEALEPVIATMEAGLAFLGREPLKGDSDRYVNSSGFKTKLVSQETFDCVEPSVHTEQDIDGHDGRVCRVSRTTFSDGQVGEVHVIAGDNSGVAHEAASVSVDTSGALTPVAPESEDIAPTVGVGGDNAGGGSVDAAGLSSPSQESSVAGSPCAVPATDFGVGAGVEAGTAPPPAVAALALGPTVGVGADGAGFSSLAGSGPLPFGAALTQLLANRAIAASKYYLSTCAFVDELETRNRVRRVLLEEFDAAYESMNRAYLFHRGMNEVWQKAGLNLPEDQRRQRFPEFYSSVFEPVGEDFLPGGAA